MADGNEGGGRADGVVDESAQLRAKLAEAESQLAAAREMADASERKRRIDRELWAEGAVDLETVALLTEAAVAGMEKADVAAAVKDLRRRKPFLFRTGPAGGAMGGRVEGEGLTAAAEEARESGDRNALLRYLRLKRGK